MYRTSSSSGEREHPSIDVRVIGLNRAPCDAFGATGVASGLVPDVATFVRRKVGRYIGPGNRLAI
jgi:hypothetical protein